MLSFEEELRIRTLEADETVLSFLPKEEGRAKDMIEAMNYSVTAGGKRLRPVMMKEAYTMFGGSGKEIGPFMAAMEMIHTHSLVHDDLPAMDNDLYRRGKKTTHAVYGESAAILAGDGLLNLGYETALKAFETAPDPARVIPALQILAKNVGYRGMIGGQSVYVALDGKKKDAATLDFIYELKTGALLEASLMIGAVLGGADREETDLMREAGSKIGMAFQIRDDILDITGSEEELGKPVHSDLKNEKETYASLYGIEKAEEEVIRLTNEAVALINKTGRENPFLCGLFEYLTGRIS